jgi:hypothetical protein
MDSLRASHCGFELSDSLRDLWRDLLQARSRLRDASKPKADFLVARRWTSLETRLHGLLYFVPELSAWAFRDPLTFGADAIRGRKALLVKPGEVS